MKQVIIPTADNQQLTCTLFYPQVHNDKKAAVMFIPGWTSNESSYHERAEAVANLGYMCLAISLRGHGQSSGELKDFSRADHLEDVLHAYDFLVSQSGVDAESISVVGASYGGYLGAVLANHRSIKHLVLRAPAFYYNKNFTTTTLQLLADREEDFFENLQVEAKNLGLEGIKQVKGQILIIESENDHIIPRNIIGLYLTAAPKGKGRVTIIKGADHQLSQREWRRGFIKFLCEFFTTV